MMQSNQKGSSLLVVVWLLVIMSIIATFLIYRSESEWVALVNSEKNAIGRELAEQTLYTRLAALLEDTQENDRPDEEWFGETGRFVTEQDGYTITVLIEDEGSKPNLNLMTENALRCFKYPKDDQPVAPLLDWLDQDQKELDDGAETPYYSSLAPAYQARDGFFSSLREVLQVKDGQEFYPVLAPELTVYGKLNFNILTSAQFQFIVKSAGFDDLTVSQLVSDFESFRGLGGKEATTSERASSFTQLVTSPKMRSLSESKCEKLKPFLQFAGSANVNFMSLKGLEAVLSYASMGQLSNTATIAKKLILFRNKIKPFETFKEIISIAGVSFNFNLEDYFTLASSLFRYRVWVEKGDCKYYINTVQERVAGDLRQKWKARALSWQVLTNKMVPEIPEATPFEETLTLEAELITNGTATPSVTQTPAESNATGGSSPTATINGPAATRQSPGSSVTGGPSPTGASNKPAGP
jgi:hypothetical protein